MAVFCGWVLLLGRILCYGSEAENSVYTNPDTGYQVWVEDGARLLTDEQLSDLAQEMREITDYGNAVFVTIDVNDFSTETFARSYYMDRFGTASGTMFLIDMDWRNIWIHSDGAVWKVVDSADAYTITDNVYRYASRGEYYECAREAFSQVHALLKGEKIARPMKYICNALLAMILALLANYGLVIHFTRLRQPKNKEILANIQKSFRYSGLTAMFTHQTEVYDSSSGGGGSGFSSGGGSSHSSHSSGGGGGRSGGGGGHRF